MTVTEEQFNCGPKEKPLPSDDELKVWSSDNLFSAYKGAWQWGNRCSNVNDNNRDYFTSRLKAREDIKK